MSVRQTVSDLRWEMFRRVVESTHQMYCIMDEGGKDEALFDSERDRNDKYAMGEYFCVEFLQNKIGVEELIGCLREIQLSNQASKVVDAVKRECTGNGNDDDDDDGCEDVVIDGFEALEQY